MLFHTVNWLESHRRQVHLEILDGRVTVNTWKFVTQFSTVSQSVVDIKRSYQMASVLKYPARKVKP